MGALIGLLLATVGVDTTTGAYRFTFDTVYLTGGISNIPVLIGLFAFSQGLINVADNFGKHRDKVSQKLERILPTKEDLVAIFPTLIRSSVIGTIIGAIPGTGGDIASWVGYNEAKRWSKHPEKFGDGAPDGIAAPEAANNAISGGALIPLLSLSIPGDACTAIMLGALMMLGITPGPLLMSESPDKVYMIGHWPIFCQCVYGNLWIWWYQDFCQNLLCSRNHSHPLDFCILLCGHFCRQPYGTGHLPDDRMRYSRLLPYQNAVLHSSHYFGYDSGRHFGKELPACLGAVQWRLDHLLYPSHLLRVYYHRHSLSVLPLCSSYVEKA